MTPVTAIIPCYKPRNYLEQALESVASQTAPVAEVVLLDDASPEPFQDIVEQVQHRHPRMPLRVIRHEVNQGLGASRNSAIAAATTPCVALLDHDDLWAPDHIEDLLPLVEHADAALCPTHIFYGDDLANLYPWGPDPDDDLSNLALSFFIRTWIVPSAVVLRKSSFEKVGGFDTDPNIHYAEDFDLWMRMLDQDMTFAVSKRATAFYRKHDEAATWRIGVMSRQCARVRERHYKAVRGPAAKKRAAVAEAYFIAARHFKRAGKGGSLALALRGAAWTLHNPDAVLRGLWRLIKTKKGETDLS